MQRLDPSSVMTLTQAVLAILVVSGTVVLMFIKALSGSQFAIPPEWWTMAALVIGYFFGAHQTASGARAMGVALICATIVTGGALLLR